MHTPIDPTRLLGRRSRLHTADGIVEGTILAVGARGYSIRTADRTVRWLSPAEVFSLNLDVAARG